MSNANSNYTFSAVNLNTINTLPAELNITNSSVPESCLKEILPCEISPLGYYLSAQVKDKIWKGQFIDILSLIPSAKLFINRPDQKLEDKPEEERSRPVARSFHNWLQSFTIYASV